MKSLKVLLAKKNTKISKSIVTKTNLSKSKNSKLITKKIRKSLYKNLLKLLYDNHFYHIGGCLSCLDIMSQVLITELGKKDKFILSKGHAAPVFYIILNYLKKLSNKELNTFLKDGTRLPAHTPTGHFKNLFHFQSGSLGHGISLSCGLAQYYKIVDPSNKKSPYVYCLISDGECNEGQIWESVQYAAGMKLNNLIVLLDRNGWQAFGKTTEVLGDHGESVKWSAFGFETFECNGHDLKAIHTSIKKAKKSKLQKPKIIICNTKKGFGVSFLEDKLESHYLKMSEDQFKQALLEVDKKL